MEDERENEKQPEDRMLRESVRVQKTLYLQEQLAKRHQEETRLLEQLLEEQRVIDGLQGSLEENMERTAETRHYNRELKESMERQVYALHGISEDLLKGMREYKNAYYRGCAAALFFLSAGLTLLCGRLHGFGEGITLLMLAGTALEGALLAQERKRVLFLDVLCRLLYLLLFPMMLVLFVFYELGYAQYGRFLPYVSMGALLLTVAGTFSYFAYNPYRKAGRRARRRGGRASPGEEAGGCRSPPGAVAGMEGPPGAAYKKAGRKAGTKNEGGGRSGGGRAGRARNIGKRRRVFHRRGRGLRGGNQSSIRRHNREYLGEKGHGYQKLRENFRCHAENRRICNPGGQSSDPVS